MSNDKFLKRAKLLGFQAVKWFTSPEICAVETVRYLRYCRVFYTPTRTGRCQAIREMYRLSKKYG